MKVKDMKLPELDTRSVLDVVEENFQKLGLKALAVRIIYVGEHTLERTVIKDHFRRSIHDVNSSYCEINVHGFLLVYDSYFVHILEGSEDTVHRQLRYIFKQEEEWIKEMEEKDKVEGSVLDTTATAEDVPKNERKMFKRLKMLMVYHSIKTLVFNQWRAVYARPPSLVGKLNLFGPLQEHMEQLRICLDKITKLCSLAKADPELNFDGLPTNDPKVEALPEVALLDFLLQSPHVMDLRHVLHLHRRVDDVTYYFELVWPVHVHFTPTFLYKLKIDDSFVEQLPVMPWEIAKLEEKEGEEMEERQSASSDSD